MRMYQDTRRLDFHALGREIKRKREAKGWTQEYLAQLVDRTPRSIMYFENRGQHPSLNTFYQIVTLLDISVDQFFYPDRQNGESDCRQHIDRLLNTMDEKGIDGHGGHSRGTTKSQRNGGQVKRAFVFLVFRGLFGGAAKWQAIRVWPHSEIFAGRRARKNACWGAPQTRCTSGQIVPKSRCAAP